MNKTRQIRDLAHQVAEIAYSDANARRRECWAAQNERAYDGPPMVIATIEPYVWPEILPADCIGAADPIYRLVETELRKKLWYASLKSDMVIEPWVDMMASYYDDSIWMWGVEMQFSEIGRSTVFNGELETPADLERMHLPKLHMDGTRTLEAHDRAAELLDGILGVHMEWRHRHMRIANPGIWTIQFMGQERFFDWCVTEPKTVGRFMALMAETFVRHNLEMQARGRLTDNHCFVPDFYPWHGPGAAAPRLADMWLHGDSELFEGISPEMTDKYLFTYLRPIYGMFGMCSFGCCESLDNKWPLVRTLPNLRRITVSECSDWDRAIDEMGERYVYTVRPSLVKAWHLDDWGQSIAELRAMARRFAGLQWSVGLPGVASIGNDATRLHRWVRLAKQTLEDAA